MHPIFKQPQNKLVVLYSQSYAGITTNLQTILNTPQNSRLKSRHPKNFPTQQILGIENFKPQKSFDHPRHLKSGVPPPPPLPGRKAILASNCTLQLRILECHTGMKCDLKGTKHYSHCIWLSRYSKYKSYLTRKS